MSEQTEVYLEKTLNIDVERHSLKLRSTDSSVFDALG